MKAKKCYIQHGQPSLFAFTVIEKRSISRLFFFSEGIMTKRSLPHTVLGKTLNFILLTLFSFSLAVTVIASGSVDPNFNAVPTKTTVDFPSSKGQVLQPDNKLVIWGGYVSADGQAKGQ